MDNALAVVPLLEEVGLVLLVRRVDPGCENHFIPELCLFETLIYEQIVLNMHGTMAALAGALPDLEPSAEPAGVSGGTTYVAEL